MSTQTSRIPVLGLVGGIGSGKSFLARGLAARRNVVIVDGDRIGHAVLNLESLRKPLHDRFGAIFLSHGEVDRRALAQLVFGPTPAHAAARADLERLVHPQIRSRLQSEIEQARAANVAEAVLLDAPLLLEAGWDALCDAVVFVDCDEVERRVRVRRDRGWSDDEFQFRESSQWPLARKRAAADLIVTSSPDLRQMLDPLEAWIDAYRVSSSSSTPCGMPHDHS
jgi:dephospho-CoA kinase